MTSTASRSSPRYFPEKNRNSEVSHSEGRAGLALRFRLPFRVSARVDPRREKTRAALDVLDIVAARDADHARKRNGEGFSRADSSRGHLLSKLSIDAALRDPALLSEVLKMAAKYQRQVSRMRRVDLL